MAVNNEPRVYFLRSKTICRGQELNYFCPPRIDPPCRRLPPVPRKRAGVGYAPPSIRQSSNPAEYESLNKSIAEQGLALLNLGACKYELVRPLLCSADFISKALIFHANFEAKLEDDPESPNELFFLELVLRSGASVKPICAYILQSLGPSDSMTDNDDDNNWRCSMCKKETGLLDKDTQQKEMGKTIRHPKNVKFNYDLYATGKVKV
ncbi:uncharacterized protein LOC141598391 [Silene latifolia]|uniref:uncharacterized protein LOC141598391 n=1 Tax=Silene latifolia TaxID=37657 RepID=UPI003D788443